MVGVGEYTTIFPSVRAGDQAGGIPLVETYKCASHYIRNIDGHTDPSCTLNILLENILAGNVVTLKAVRQAAAETVTAQKALRSRIKH